MRGFTFGKINASLKKVIHSKYMQFIEQFIKNYIEFIVPVLILIVIALLVWNIYTHLNLRKIKEQNQALFAGNKVKNLEGVILEQAKSIKTLDKDIQELYNISNQINNLSLRSLHKTGLVRFNPFKEVGGDQSFSIALLNGKNNGIVLSSLYTREGTRIYSKAITAGKSEKYPLTEEEKQSIKIAMSNEPKKIN